MTLTDTQTDQGAADAALMLRITNQDQAALMDLYQRFGGQVYGLVLRVLRDTQLAEEATQDTFLKVWHKAEQWDSSRGQLSSWLLTIARYAAIDRLRREQRHSSTSVPFLDSLAENASAPERVGDRRWLDGQLLRQFMATLPEEQALVIELAFFQGMTHSELAEHLQWPLGTVKTRLRSGLQKLRGLWIDSQESSAAG